MWPELIYFVSIIFFACLFYKFGKEDGYREGSVLGFNKGYAKAVHDRIKKT